MQAIERGHNRSAKTPSPKNPFLALLLCRNRQLHAAHSKRYPLAYGLAHPFRIYYHLLYVCPTKLTALFRACKHTCDLFNIPITPRIASPALATGPAMMMMMMVMMIVVRMMLMMMMMTMAMRMRIRMRMICLAVVRAMLAAVVSQSHCYKTRKQKAFWQAVLKSGSVAVVVLSPC